MDVLTVQASDNSTGATAFCPADHLYALGGGGDVQGGKSPYLVQSFPFTGGTGSTPSGWFAQASDGIVTAWAICAR